MGSLRYTKQLFLEFFKRWESYLFLVGIVTAAVRIIVIPIIRFLATSIIGLGKIPYLSLDNWWNVFTSHPIVGILLSVLGLLIFVLVYFQYSILLIGINNIRLRKANNFRELFQSALTSAKNLNVSSLLAFIFYLIFLLPLFGQGFNSELISKVRVPIFAIDEIIKNPLIDLTTIFIYMILFYFATRLVLVLKLTVIDQNKLIDAMKLSWKATKNKFWHLVFKIVVIGLISTLLVFGWANLLYFLQTQLDKIPNLALPGAVINMLLLLAGNLFFEGVIMVLYLLFMISPLEFEVLPVSQKISKKMKRSVRLGAIITILGLLAVMVTYNFTFLFGGFDYQPLMISHRGVDTENGVQNTIQSLEKTAKEHPDFVEMDIHETKDHQFVVMHDADLVGLAGINKKVHDLTLDELKQTKIHENGYTTYISSFDDYLDTADRIGQKLIVEIKTTPQDSPQMLNNFMKKYASRLQREKHRVHSLTYDVVEKLHQKYPKLYTSLILPYTLIYPKTSLNGYTLEETTLDTTTMNQASKNNQAIWAWTVDDPDDMAQMMSLGVDGIITNNLSELKQVIKLQNDHPSYAQRLRNFGQTISDLSGSDIEN